MRVSKNKVSSLKAGINFELCENLCDEPIIAINLWGNSSCSLLSVEEANEMEKTLSAAIVKVRQWKKKLKYKTYKW